MLKTFSKPFQFIYLVMSLFTLLIPLANKKDFCHSDKSLFMIIYKFTGKTNALLRAKSKISKLQFAKDKKLKKKNNKFTTFIIANQYLN